MGLHTQVSLKEEAAIKRWLSFYKSGNCRRSRLSILNSWIAWLKQNPDFKNVTPQDLIMMQKIAVGDDRYRLLDLLQDFIKERDATFNSNNLYYSTIKSFFEGNRVALPEDKFNIPYARDPNKAKLTVDHVRLLSLKADYGMIAFYQTLWQSLMDQERFQYFNLNYGGQLSEHLKTKGVDEPFLIEYPGRKQTRGKLYFYTFIGRDALVMWKNYFDVERNYPEEGEAIFINSDGKPQSKQNIYIRHLRFCERLRFYKRSGEIHTRYGFNLHEFRDLAKTVLHLEGRKNGLDLDAVDFWMGHLPDRNQYDKFYTDRKYMLEQYRIAEKHLNIISGSQEQQLGNIDEVIDKIIMNKAAFEKLLDALETKLGSKLAPKDQKYIKST